MGVKFSLFFPVRRSRAPEHQKKLWSNYPSSGGFTSPENFSSTGLFVHLGPRDLSQNAKRKYFNTFGKSAIFAKSNIKILKMTLRL